MVSRCTARCEISPKRRYESTEARSDSWTGFSFDIWYRRITFRVNVKSRLIKLVLLPLGRGDSYTFGREEEYPCRIFFPSCCIQWIHISGFEEWEIVWHRGRQLAGLRRLLRILLYLFAVVFSNQWACRQSHKSTCNSLNYKSLYGFKPASKYAHSHKKTGWWAYLHFASNRHNRLDVRLLYGRLQVCQDAHWFRNQQRFYVDPGFYVEPNLRNCRQLRQK